MERPSLPCQIEGETVADCIFLGSKIMADGDCSHEIKRHLLLGRKAMINPDSMLKSRYITWPTKVHLVKAMVFPVVIEWLNFSFFSIIGQGIDLDYCDIEWFALEMNRDHSVVFEIVSKSCL